MPRRRRGMNSPPASGSSTAGGPTAGQRPAATASAPVPSVAPYSTASAVHGAKPKSRSRCGTWRRSGTNSPARPRRSRKRSRAEPGRTTASASSSRRVTVSPHSASGTLTASTAGQASQAPPRSSPTRLATPRRKPTSRLPESPRKMRGVRKLCGRKPTSAPASPNRTAVATTCPRARLVSPSAAAEIAPTPPATVAIPLGAFAPPLAVLWIVTLTNAVNMTDVVDGVAGGVGAISAAALGLTSLALGHVVATAVLFGLAGALVGFLPHNFPSPRIFLGDSGSLLVGFLLGVASLVGLERGGAWLAWPAVLAVSVPLAECGLTVTRRLLLALAVVRPGSARERFLLRRGRAGLFVPDRRHVPHRLRDLGFAPGGPGGATVRRGSPRRRAPAAP